MNDDPKRVAPPEEMPEPRFSDHLNNYEKNEIINRCVDGSHEDFLILLGRFGVVDIQSQLQNIPWFVNPCNRKGEGEYTLDEAASCVRFTHAFVACLSKMAVEADRDDINDLFLPANLFDGES